MNHTGIGSQQVNNGILPMGSMTTTINHFLKIWTPKVKVTILRSPHFHLRVWPNCGFLNKGLRGSGKILLLTASYEPGISQSLCTLNKCIQTTKKLKTPVNYFQEATTLYLHQKESNRSQVYWLAVFLFDLLMRYITGTSVLTLACRPIQLVCLYGCTSWT